MCHCVNGTRPMGMLLVISFYFFRKFVMQRHFFLGSIFLLVGFPVAILQLVKVGFLYISKLYREYKGKL